LDETAGGVLRVAEQGEFDELCTAALLAELLQLDDELEVQSDRAEVSV
jgi:hypothetical protein